MKPQRTIPLDSEEIDVPVDVESPQPVDRAHSSGHHPIAMGQNQGASYLPDPALGWAGSRWREIQAEFVDDPRRSVADAHALVDDLVQRIVHEFTKERDNLERQWAQGEQVSTEELRVCLQRYRSFFTRLLPTAESPR